MTAVVGILNKQGIAIAADSAVTVSGLQNRKVYNSANKIFTLSKLHPVGIALYNNAQFMGIPWETLIKEFRKELGSSSFSTLEEYKEQFLTWLMQNEHLLSEENIDYVFQDLLGFLQVVLGEIERNSIGSSGKNNLEKKLLLYFDNYIKNDIPTHPLIESLKGLDTNKLIQTLHKFEPQLDDALANSPEVQISAKAILTPLLNAYIAYLQHDQFLQFTGLIFIGFGEKEYFPRLIPVSVSILIDGNLRHYTNDSMVGVIDNKHLSSCIRPFAQTDVIDTVLQGVSPELNQLSSKVFRDFLSEFVGEIQKVEGFPKEIGERLNNLDVNGYVNRYLGQFNNIVSQKYVRPLMGAVAQLSKEDLAEMAESLVYLTYLKRRFTMAEESVGGPVDIAVITKGDGFIWIKRKHYFDPELNQTYFQKYF